jgi:hypothetical protein
MFITGKPRRDTKKLLIIASISSLFFTAEAQTFEKKIVERSCDCLKKQKLVTDSIQVRCISSSMLEIVLEDSAKNYQQQISTVQQIQNMTRTVRAKLKKSCQNILKPENE